MTLIMEAVEKSDARIKLEEWFNETWPGFASIETNKDGLDLPDPLVALSGDTLQGGLAYTYYESPLDETLSLWVNALYVDEDHRGQGIGLMLVKAAASYAKRAGLKDLFAYTNVPDLYLKAGWTIVKEDRDHWVLKMKNEG